MAIHIRLVRNNIKSSKSYGKYFAKAVSQGEVTMKEPAEEAATNCGISRDEVISMMAAQAKKPDLPPPETIDDERRRDNRDAALADRTNKRFSRVEFIF